jgi:DNA replication protein DnaD
MSDHDLLVVLHTKLQGVVEDIRQIKENTASRLSRLEDNSLTKAEADKIVTNAQKNAAVTHTDMNKKIDDHERRIRNIERYVWSAIALIGAANFVLQIYLKFA